MQPNSNLRVRARSFHSSTPTQSIPSHQVLNDTNAFIWVFKYLPGVSWHPLKSSLKAFGIILLVNANGANLGCLADKNQLDPSRHGSIPGFLE